MHQPKLYYSVIYTEMIIQVITVHALYTNHVKWRTPLTIPSVVPPVEKQGTGKLP